MSRANPRYHRTNQPLPPLVGPTFRIQVIYTVDNQRCLWGLDYTDVTGVLNDSTETTLATSFDSLFHTNLQNVLATDCTIVGILCTCLTSLTRRPSLLAVNRPGTATGGSLGHIPSEMAVVVQKQTSHRGQHGRGRFSLPGCPTQFITATADANRLNTTGYNTFATLVSYMATTAIVDGINSYTPALTQRPNRGQATTLGAALTSFQLNSLLGTVRRRKIGRGK